MNPNLATVPKLLYHSGKYAVWNYLWHSITMVARILVIYLPTPKSLELNLSDLYVMLFAIYVDPCQCWNFFSSFSFLIL